MNCLAKLFTQCLNARIAKWCEAYNIIPEWQAGFRSNRGCLDNIFTLNMLIQFQLRKNKGKLYGLFVDLKSAFDSVDHNLLWRKLLNLGLSTKIINILKYFYSAANLKISNNQGCTDSVKVTKGVLQGETLSPLLFALFLYDLEAFLINKGVRGVTASHFLEILVLAYADDIVLLADSYVGMKKVLLYFHEYCLINKLTVNLDKTKIVLFQKGGHGHKKNLHHFFMVRTLYNTLRNMNT